MALAKQLQDLGFSPSEAHIYLTLLEIGPASAGEISKKTQINRTSTYQTIERMIAKGLVSFMRKGKRRIFQAIPAETLLSWQEEKTHLVQDIIPELQKISKHIEEEAIVFKGRRGIRSIMNEILKCKEYVSFGSGGQFAEVMGHDFLLYQKEKQTRHIKSKVILGKSSKRKPIVTKAYAQFRFIDDKYMTPTTTWIYNDKIAIVVWTEIPIATLIKSRDVANAYRAYFELLWKSAKK